MGLGKGRQELNRLAAARKKAAKHNVRNRARAIRVVEAQRKEANRRAKYGASGKPAPVVVKSLETGEVLDVVDQSRVR